MEIETMMPSGENKSELPDLKQIAERGFAAIDKFYGAQSARRSSSRDLTKMQSGGQNKINADLRQTTMEGFALIDKFYGPQRRPFYHGHSNTSRCFQEAASDCNATRCFQEAASAASDCNATRCFQEAASYCNATRCFFGRPVAVSHDQNNMKLTDLREIGLERVALIDQFHGPMLRPAYHGYSNTSRCSQAAASGRSFGRAVADSHDQNNSRNVKKTKPKHNGDVNGNTNANGKALSCIDVPIGNGEIPNELKKMMMNKILDAKGRIGSQFKGSDYRSLFEFACQQLLCGKPFAHLSWEWSQVLQELKSLELDLESLNTNNNSKLHHHHASSSSSQQPLQVIPSNQGPNLTPVLVNYHHVINGEQNLKSVINNQNGLVLGHANGSIFFYFYLCQIILIM